MTWTLSQIKAAYDEGVRLGASHMIVAHTNVDFDQTAVYVMPGQDPRETWDNFSDAKNSGYTAVDECYYYKLGWESQSKEHRALHWEWDKPEEKKILDASNLAVKAVLNFTSGIELPYTIPLYQAPVGMSSRYDRAERSGTVFVSLEELESLSETEPFNSFVLLSREAEQAVVDAGWAVRTTRGGVVSTEEFRKSTVVHDLFVKCEPVWKKQAENRVEAILATFSMEDFKELSRLLSPNTGLR